MIPSLEQTSISYTLGLRCANGLPRSADPKVVWGAPELIEACVHNDERKAPLTHMVLAFPEPLSRIGNPLMIAAALGSVSALTGCRNPFRIPTLVVAHAEFGFSGDSRSGCCHPHIFVFKRDPRTDLTVSLFSNTKADWGILDEFCRNFELRHQLVNAVVEGRLHKKFKPDYPRGLPSGQKADLCAAGRECCLDVAKGRAKTRSDFEQNFERKNLKIERIYDDGITINTPAGQSLTIAGGIMSRQQKWGEVRRVFKELSARNEKAVTARKQKQGARDSVFEKRRREWEQKYEKSSKGGPLGKDYIEALGGRDTFVHFGTIAGADPDSLVQPGSGTIPTVERPSDGNSEIECRTRGDGITPTPIEMGRGVSSGGGSVDAVSRNRPHSSRIPDEERDTVGGQSFADRESGLKNEYENRPQNLAREPVLPAETKELNGILKNTSRFGINGDQSEAAPGKRGEKSDAANGVPPDPQGADLEDEFTILERAKLPKNLHDVLKPYEDVQEKLGRSAPERGFQR